MVTSHRFQVHRAGWVRRFILLACAALLVRVVYIQLPARDQHLSQAPVKPGQGSRQVGERGRILDRHYRVLAESLPAVTVAVAPSVVQNWATRGGGVRRESLNSADLQRNPHLQEAASTISATLALDYDEVLTRLSWNRQYTVLARAADPDRADELRRLRIQDAPGEAGAKAPRPYRLPGLLFERTHRREYPFDTMAAGVIGYCNAEQIPSAGVEAAFRQITEGRRVAVGGPSGGLERHLPASLLGPRVRPPPGKDLVLTLDLGTQQVVEQALDEMVALRAPKGATVVVISAHDGAILAMAGRPHFNPNLISKSRTRMAPVPAEHLINRAVSRPMEPGSTFKLLTIAAALDYGVITEHTRFHCKGTDQVGGHPLRCWGEWATRGHGSLTPAEILSNSCNLGAAQVALRLGAERFHEFLSGCGIGEHPGSGLPGESRGQIMAPERMRVRDLASVGFGQGVSVTDLQLTNAIAAIMNGGVLYKPRIVEGYLDPVTGGAYEVQRAMVRRVCKPSTSEAMRRLARYVVDEGTGRPAQIPGFAVGGKTATAQIWDTETGKYLRGSQNQMMGFVLVAPVERRPDFVILVNVERPQVGQFGSEIAGPIARRIAEYLLSQTALFPRWQEPAESPPPGPDREPA